MRAMAGAVRKFKFKIQSSNGYIVSLTVGFSMIHVNVQVDEDRLKETHKFQCHLQRDRNQIVVQDDECKEIVSEVLRDVCEVN